MGDEAMTVAEEYLKRAELVELPSAKDIIEAFLRSKDKIVEVDYEKLGVEQERMYMRLKQAIKATQAPVSVHRRGTQLILRRLEV